MKIEEWVMSHGWWDDKNQLQHHEPAKLLALVKKIYPIPPGVIGWFEVRETNQGERCVLLYEATPTGEEFVKFIEFAGPINPNANRVLIFTNDNEFYGVRSILDWLSRIFFLVSANNPDHPEMVVPIYPSAVVAMNSVDIDLLSEPLKVRIQYSADGSEYVFTSTATFVSSDNQNLPVVSGRLTLHEGQILMKMTKHYSESQETTDAIQLR